MTFAYTGNDKINKETSVLAEAEEWPLITGNASNASLLIHEDVDNDNHVESVD